MRNRLRYAQLLKDGKLGGKELEAAQANPLVVAEAQWLARESNSSEKNSQARRVNKPAQTRKE